MSRVELGVAVACALGEEAAGDLLAGADGVAWFSGTGWDSRAWCGRAADGVGAGEPVAAGPVPGISLASTASALCTADSVSCWLVLVEMPWPSRDTASKLPAVAAPTPMSQAPTPAATRMCTWQRLRMRG